MTNKPVTLRDVEKVFESFLLMEDRDFVRLVLATIIGNQLPGKRPIWLMIVAPSSSGKTTLLNAVHGLKLNTRAGEEFHPIHDISDLTENSFASGMMRHDTETSLLHKIPDGGLMVFKDFTSVLSKRSEAKMIIMSQLREIYDGRYIKRTGTGQDITWQGKIGAIAGVTEVIYRHIESLSVMGDRFMLYQVSQPDRKKVLRFKLEKEREGITEDDQMIIAKEKVQDYLQRAFDNLQPSHLKLPDKIEDEIIDVADFCTTVRSGIVINEYTQKIQFVPQPEMPARMFEQMIALGSTLAYMRTLDDPKANIENALTENDFKLMYKIAFDSIPVTRRIALRYLTQYKQGVTTAGLATKINYPSDVVRNWLEQLNALGAVNRIAGSSFNNKWVLADKYRKVMLRLESVKVVDELMDDHEPSEIDKHWETGGRKNADATEYLNDSDDW